MSVAWSAPSSPEDYEQARMPSVMGQLKQGLESAAPYHQLQVLYAEPSKTFAGMIVYADGTTWNPGSGEGVYRRDKANAAWQFLGTGTITTSSISDFNTAVDARLGLVLLSTQTASNSATLDFTTGITSTYDEYIFELVDLVPATNSVQAQMLTSTDGGSSWAGGTGYWYGITIINMSSAATAVVASAGAAFIALTTTGAIGNASTDGVAGTIRLFGPSGASVYKKLTIQTTAVSGSNAYTANGGAVRAAAADIDAVRFQMSSGNITSGSIRMYGVRKT